jgi:hypothetical protein
MHIELSYLIKTGYAKMSFMQKMGFVVEIFPPKSRVLWSKKYSFFKKHCNFFLNHYAKPYIRYIYYHHTLLFATVNVTKNMIVDYF